MIVRENRVGPEPKDQLGRPQDRQSLDFWSALEKRSNNSPSTFKTPILSAFVTPVVGDHHRESTHLTLATVLRGQDDAGKQNGLKALRATEPREWSLSRLLRKQMFAWRSYW